MSVNQLNAQMQLCDMCKAVNVDKYPTKVNQMPLTIDTTQTRSITNGKLIETGKTILPQATLINDATKA